MINRPSGSIIFYPAHLLVFFFYHHGFLCLHMLIILIFLNAPACFPATAGLHFRHFRPGFHTMSFFFTFYPTFLGSLGGYPRGQNSACKGSNLGLNRVIPTLTLHLFYSAYFCTFAHGAECVFLCPRQAGACVCSYF